jgi:hypothetical protein
MSDLKPRKVEFGVLSDLAEQIERAKDILFGSDSSLVKVSREVDVYDESALPLRINYYQKKNRDTIIRSEGLTPSTPYVAAAGRHAASYFTGHGLHLYQNYLDPSLRYVVYEALLGNGVKTRFVIVPKGLTYRLYRNAMRATQRAGEGEEPVLAAGLLKGILRHTIDFLRQARKIEKYGVRIRQGWFCTARPATARACCAGTFNTCAANTVTVAGQSPRRKLRTAFKKFFGRPVQPLHHDFF